MLSRAAGRKYCSFSGALRAPLLLLWLLAVPAAWAQTSSPNPSTPYSPSTESSSKHRPNPNSRFAKAAAHALHAPAGRRDLGEALEQPVAQEQRPAAAGEPAAQAALVIDRVDFVGNRRVRTDTLKARIFTREGDAYSEETLKRDFQALWNTQFFDDVKLRVEVSPKRPNARIIIFDVQERPVIRRIRYDGIHSVSESDILDRFKEKKVGLTVESQFDPTRIKKAEVVLRDLLAEHGRQFAKVKPQYEKITASNAVILVFKVDEGPKVKVGRIRFTGNHAFSDRKLIRAMRHSRPYAIPLYFANLNAFSKTFDRQKLNEDLEVGVRGMYQDSGYFKVTVKDPILENVEIVREGIPVPLLPFVSRKQGKAVNITIPIDEGSRYVMGKLNIVPADPDKPLSLKVEPLKSIFPLKTGDLFAVGKIRKALEEYRKVYGNYGFIDFTAEPDSDVDEDNKRINLTLRFNEEKQFYVRRIEFSGNTTTRDKVIRREVLVDEGQLFNQRAWEMSILRLNQLDYFEQIKPENAEIARNTKDGTVDITLKVKEKGKQSIGLQGGFSGLAGSFVGLTYQTNNFLGLGETLTFSSEFGDRQRNFMFGFTEPYLFDRPISTGFTIFSSRYSFNQAQQAAQMYNQQISANPQLIQNYNQNSTGFTVFASYPIRRFSFTRIGLTYSLSKTNITAFSDASKLLFETVQFRSLAGPSATNGILSSNLTPTISYNTVNHPINPTGGKSFSYSLSMQGGVLGGNVNAITNVFEHKHFFAVHKHRNVFGYRVQTAFTTSFGGLELPPNVRFYMGGEDTVRGFDIRTISPVAFIPIKTSVGFSFPDIHHLDANGNPIMTSRSIPALTYQMTFPGGDLQGLGNIEYRIPIVGPVTMAFFLDGGTTGIIKRNGLQLNPVGLQDLQTTFPGASLGGQLPLGSRTNFHLRSSAGVEFVVQLPIVQAPFRIYYAYNVSRLRQQIIGPNNYIEPSSKDSLINELSSYPGVYDNLFKPFLDAYPSSRSNLNFFEPTHTFRFTVSRTF
ncbi:MAG: outer membrane protein assembly factor BamA [Acidobacteriia bacterium]|nr:outer membrane protein assembly factor BamA [Terriglobia bacterium]